MNVKKAVITLAGQDQRALPQQSLIDRDGIEKSVLSILLAEVVGAGVEAVCLVVMPGDETNYAAAAGPFASRVHFVSQPEPSGYGAAIACASEFVADDSFLHLVGDHIYVSGDGRSSAAKLVTLAAEQGCTISAVKATRERLLPYYGVVGGRPVAGQTGLYQVEKVLEKPTPTLAEQLLIVPGLRAGHYLCLFGMHVLSPTVMPILQAQLAEATDPREVNLTTALNELAGREKYLAVEHGDLRYDLGVKYGLLQAQLALGLSGRDREEVLALLLEHLAQRDLDRGGS